MSATIREVPTRIWNEIVAMVDIDLASDPDAPIAAANLDVERVGYWLEQRKRRERREFLIGATDVKLHDDDVRSHMRLHHVFHTALGEDLDRQRDRRLEELEAETADTLGRWLAERVDARANARDQDTSA